jgi:hypothetical protein
MADETDQHLVIDLDEPGTPAAPDTVGAGVVQIADDGEDPDALPPQALPQPDGSVILPLRFPVTMQFRRRSSAEVRTETTTELHFRRLRGEDLRAMMAASNETKAVVAIARSTRISEAMMKPLYDRMDGADAAAASQVVMHFLGNGRPTGR